MKDYTIDDEFIRDALQYDVGSRQELNSRILNNLEQKRRGTSYRKSVLVFVLVLCALVGSGFGVNAATGGRLIELVRGKIDNETYVISGTQTSVEERVNPDGTVMEIVNFEEDRACLENPILEGQTLFSMAFRIETDGIIHFFNVNASVSAEKGETTEDLYYAIISSFHRYFSDNWYYREDVKAEVVKGIKEAIAKTKLEAVRDALTDFLYNYENNRKIYIDEWHLDRKLNIVAKSWICEDLTGLDAGHIAIVTNATYGREETYILEIFANDAENPQIGSSQLMFFEQDKLDELKNQGVRIYDRRTSIK